MAMRTIHSQGAAEPYEVAGIADMLGGHPVPIARRERTRNKPPCCSAVNPQEISRCDHHLLDEGSGHPRMAVRHLASAHTGVGGGEKEGSRQGLTPLSQGQQRDFNLSASRHYSAPVWCPSAIYEDGKKAVENLAPPHWSGVMSKDKDDLSKTWTLQQIPGVHGAEPRPDKEPAADPPKKPSEK